MYLPTTHEVLFSRTLGEKGGGTESRDIDFDETNRDVETMIRPMMNCA